MKEPLYAALIIFCAISKENMPLITEELSVWDIGLRWADAARVAFLFERYQQLTSLLPAALAKKSRKPRS